MKFQFYCVHCCTLYVPIIINYSNHCKNAVCAISSEPDNERAQLADVQQLTNYPEMLLVLLNNQTRRDAKFHRGLLTFQERDLLTFFFLGGFCWAVSASVLAEN